ncbi:hypothetical protein LCGC14_1844360 [marine sediment metagenome]|uniref:Uncharacterized protein n=1 Tax=marine sediment metagenome TaxID=412755 RepID=A0A0F9GCH5_9ZZZZ
MTDKEWEKFVKDCKKHWDDWKPSRVSIEIYLKWRDDEYRAIHEGTKKEAQG